MYQEDILKWLAKTLFALIQRVVFLGKFGPAWGSQIWSHIIIFRMLLLLSCGPQRQAARRSFVASSRSFCLVVSSTWVTFFQEYSTRWTSVLSCRRVGYFRYGPELQRKSLRFFVFFWSSSSIHNLHIKYIQTNSSLHERLIALTKFGIALNLTCRESFGGLREG